MTDIRTVSPVDGRRVRSPTGKLLDAPTDVPWNSYWERLANAGDIAVKEAVMVAAILAGAAVAVVKPSLAKDA